MVLNLYSKVATRKARDCLNKTLFKIGVSARRKAALAGAVVTLTGVAAEKPD